MVISTIRGVVVTGLVVGIVSIGLGLGYIAKGNGLKEVCYKSTNMRFIDI
jgi:hypothetical protein